MLASHVVTKAGVQAWVWLGKKGLERGKSKSVSVNSKNKRFHIYSNSVPLIFLSALRLQEIISCCVPGADPSLTPCSRPSMSRDFHPSPWRQGFWRSCFPEGMWLSFLLVAQAATWGRSWQSSPRRAPPLALAGSVQVKTILANLPEQWSQHVSFRNLLNFKNPWAPLLTFKLTLNFSIKIVNGCKGYHFWHVINISILTLTII